MKRITAKIGTYEKEGQTKGRYMDIGVIMSNQNGEYILLNPTVDLAGVLVRQRLMDPKKAGSSVICSIFDDTPQDEKQPPKQSAPELDDEIPFAHAWLVPAAGLFLGLATMGQNIV